MTGYTDKPAILRDLNGYMYSRTLNMFQYEGLPESIPEMELEKQLQKNGFSFITKHNDTLYALQGHLGGEPDVYGNPVDITITNPAIKLNKTLPLSDGVLMVNDDMMLGLDPLYNRYNTLLMENEISMMIATYSSRMQTLLSAGDDTTKESAEAYLEKVVDGELGIIGENRLFEGIKTHQTQSANNHMKTIIEFHQYIKAGLFNEVGLNANYNMKRERLNTSEVDMNTDQLHSLVDNMLNVRKRAVAQLNEKYGLSITVDFDSIWKTRNDLMKQELLDEPEDEPEDEPLSAIDFIQLVDPDFVSRETIDERGEELDVEQVVGSEPEPDTDD